MEGEIKEMEYESDSEEELAEEEIEKQETAAAASQARLFHFTL